MRRLTDKQRELLLEVAERDTLNEGSGDAIEVVLAELDERRRAARARRIITASQSASLTRTPIDPAAFRRRVFEGNPPFAPYVYGWQVSLGGPATVRERAWLRAHRYTFHGGSWWRASRGV